MNLPPILCSLKVAELLQCSPRTVEDRARDGSLPGVKVGMSWIFPTQALLEALNEEARRNLNEQPVSAVAVRVHDRRVPPVLLANREWHR